LAATRKTKAKPKSKPAVELDELEDLEDLEEVDEEEPEDEDEDSEDEDEDEIDEDEDEEDEAPVKSKKKSKKSKARDDGKIGTKELAEALETSGRELRVMLRQKGVEKNENARYEWDSVEEAVEEMGFKSLASAKKGLKESRAQRLTELKDRVAASKKKKGAAKKGKKKAAPVVEEDDEEDEDDE
jgi:hypothetical protein